MTTLTNSEKKTQNTMAKDQAQVLMIKWEEMAQRQIFWTTRESSLQSSSTRGKRLDLRSIKKGKKVEISTFQTKTLSAKQVTMTLLEEVIIITIKICQLAITSPTKWWNQTIAEVTSWTWMDKIPYITKRRALSNSIVPVAKITITKRELWIIKPLKTSKWIQMETKTTTMTLTWRRSTLGNKIQTHF